MNSPNYLGEGSSTPLCRFRHKSPPHTIIVVVVAAVAVVAVVVVTVFVVVNS